MATRPPTVAGTRTPCSWTPTASTRRPTCRGYRRGARPPRRTRARLAPVFDASAPRSRLARPALALVGPRGDPPLAIDDLLCGFRCLPLAPAVTAGVPHTAGRITWSSIPRSPVRLVGGPGRGERADAGAVLCRRGVTLPSPARQRGDQLRRTRGWCSACWPRAPSPRSPLPSAARECRPLGRGRRARVDDRPVDHGPARIECWAAGSASPWSSASSATLCHRPTRPTRLTPLSRAAARRAGQGRRRARPPAPLRDSFRHYREFGLAVLDRLRFTLGAGGHRDRPAGRGMPGRTDRRQARRRFLLGAHLAASDAHRVLAERTGVVVNVMMVTRHASRINALPGGSIRPPTCACWRPGRARGRHRLFA